MREGCQKAGSTLRRHRRPLVSEGCPIRRVPTAGRMGRVWRVRGGRRSSSKDLRPKKGHCHVYVILFGFNARLPEAPSCWTARRSLAYVWQPAVRRYNLALITSVESIHLIA